MINYKQNQTILSKKWILSFLLFFPFLCFSQKYTSSVQLSGVQYLQTKINNKDFTRLLLSGSDYSDKIGEPDLPIFYKTFYIPKNLKVADVTFISYKKEEVQLSFDLMPVQPPKPTSLYQHDMSFAIPDKIIYDRNEYYPLTQAQVHHSDYFDGDIQLVTVKVCPIQYNPQLKKLIISTEWEINLNTIPEANMKSSLLESMGDLFHDEKSIDVLKSLVVNSQEISIDNQNVQMRASNQSAWSIPFYEYVIVTSKTLKPAFSEFIAWKKRKGYNAGIVTIEDILDDPAAVGDKISRLYDNAGKLRQYLSDGYFAGVTKYALLGGDHNVVPIRYGCAGDNTWDYISGKDTVRDERKVPSDLYFSDFNGNWNVDGDVYTGEESGDAVDYAAEIYIGRILCNNEIDVKNWTLKALKYELNPGNGDYSYLSKWLASQADEMQANQQAENVAQYLPSFFSAKKILNELPSYTSANPTFPKGADVIAELNQNYGIYSNFNHGGAMGYGTASRSGLYGTPIYGHDVHSNVVSVDDYDLNDSYFFSARPEPYNGFDNLTNFDYPTILYSISCTNMPFDDYGTPDNCRNCAEAFMCMNLSGGPAYLGNTRNGWIYGSSRLYTEFLRQISSITNLGKAEALSKITYSGYKKHWMALAHNLAGCPEMPLWTSTPSKLSPSIGVSGNKLFITTGGVAVDKICVMGAVNSNYFEVKTDVSSAVFTDVPKPYYVTITKKNYIPYRNSIGNVYVQNEYFSSMTYLTCDNVYAGYSVTTDIPVGNVVIPNGGNVVFDAENNIILDAGFEVQLGGFFETK